MANTVASLEKAFKYVQEEKLKDLKPNSSIVYELAPMKAPDKIGRLHLTSVVLSFELGFTFGDGGAFTYEDDVAGIYSQIEVTSNPVVLKSRLSIEAADRMANGGDKTTIDHVTLRTGQVKTSLLKMAEIEMLHGKTGVGVIGAVTPSSTTAQITFTDATWAGGIWAGMKGAKLEFRRAATKINALADVVITAVLHDSKTLSVSGNATDLAALAAADVAYFKGAYSNGQFGIKYQLSTSGTIFGIDNTVYDLFKANTSNVAGALTIGVLLAESSKPVIRGGLDTDCIVLMSPKTWEKANADLAALRVMDESYKTSKGENGTNSIVYHAQFGAMELISHPMVMEGDAFLLPKKAMKRVGSTDVTFSRIDGTEGAWTTLPNEHAYQLTGRYSFQIVIQEPAKCLYLSGITNA